MARFPFNKSGGHSPLIAGCIVALVMIAFTQQDVFGQGDVKEVEVAVITTDHGEMLIEFWPDVAPNTVENFKKLAGEEFYNGTAFHRIMAGFMIQGGDPLTKDEDAKGRWGTGGPGRTIDAEFNDRKHVRGVISMARGPDENSAGSQFFVCLDDASFLDGKYTAFGKLIAGDDVLEKLGATEVEASRGGEQSSPVERVNVTSITIETREIEIKDQ